MDGTRVLKCPNCGGTDIVDVGIDSRRCEYCGTVIRSPEPALYSPKCPRCGFENEPSSRYCNQCGLAIAKWASPNAAKTDLAIISIMATVVGSFFVPVGGAILGLVLAYKARTQARATGGRSGSEDLASTTIVVGWVGLIVTLLPMCLFPAMVGGQISMSVCSGMLELPAVVFTQ